MSTEEDREAALSAWAASDAPQVHPGATTHRGEDARAAARALLEGATEDDPEGRELVRAARGRGRPRLNPDLEPGEGPVWTVRTPVELDAAMRARAKAERRPLSEILRQAAAEYLAVHEAS
ncbi:ribbon-helix-helix protein, CopG family [Cellulomonas sp. 179-A 4D5 NHS]|uniref:ribbon-helix-helix protein, CopG family n=1 Tax=Cellulomonas sp. 179-A 4D5 NHS TaxID=3142378 RepID=UPI00399F28A3